MLKKYFSENEFQYAISLLENNPYAAKERFEEYLSKYPTDYYARAYYVILLTRICLFKEAEKEYNNIIEQSHNDSFYAYGANRIKGFKHNMAIAKLKILGSQEKYQEILLLLQNNYELLNDTDRRYISYYCRSKLGMLNIENTPRYENAYRFNQSVDYNEDMFRLHIKKHEADYNIDVDEVNPAIFVPDFPLDNIIDEIKKYIPSDKGLFLGYFDDTYYFKYDNCGRINNKLVSYFKVVCFHNTVDFITMYPTNECEKLPVVDLNYLKEKDEKTKVKTLSQIDKFNKRFNRK